MKMKNCAICNAKLAGTGQGARTKKRPSRRFSGVLCHSCTEQVMKLKSRLDDKKLKPGQVDLAYKNYVEQVVVKTEPKTAKEKPAKKKKPAAKKGKKEESREKRKERIKKRRKKK